MFPPKPSSESKEKEPKGGLAIVIGGKPSDGGKDADIFLPASVLGEHAEGIEEGKEYKVTMTIKVTGKDEEGVDATVTEISDVDSAGDDFGGTEEEDDMDSRFKEHSEDEGEDTPDGFAGGMKG